MNFVFFPNSVRNKMKAKTAIRLYCVALIMLLGGWCINLVAALNRPTVDWRDAAGAPMLVLVWITLTMLLRARSKVTADLSASIRLGTGRYVLVGLTAGGLIAAFLLGFHAH
jgi:hypothetical protein